MDRRGMRGPMMRARIEMLAEQIRFYEENVRQPQFQDVDYTSASFAEIDQDQEVLIQYGMCIHYWFTQKETHQNVVARLGIHARNKRPIGGANALLPQNLDLSAYSSRMIDVCNGFMNRMKIRLADINGAAVRADVPFPLDIDYELKDFIAGDVGEELMNRFNEDSLDSDSESDVSDNEDEEDEGNDSIGSFPMNANEEDEGNAFSGSFPMDPEIESTPESVVMEEDVQDLESILRRGADPFYAEAFEIYHAGFTHFMSHTHTHDDAHAMSNAFACVRRMSVVLKYMNPYRVMRKLNGPAELTLTSVWTNDGILFTCDLLRELIKLAQTEQDPAKSNLINGFAEFIIKNCHPASLRVVSLPGIGDFSMLHVAAGMGDTRAMNVAIQRIETVMAEGHVLFDLLGTEKMGPREAARLVGRAYVETAYDLHDLWMPVMKMEEKIRMPARHEGTPLRLLLEYILTCVQNNRPLKDGAPALMEKASVLAGKMRQNARPDDTFAPEAELIASLLAAAEDHSGSTSGSGPADATQQYSDEESLTLIKDALPAIRQTVTQSGAAALPPSSEKKRKRKD